MVLVFRNRNTSVLWFSYPLSVGEAFLLLFCKFLFRIHEMYKAIQHEDLVWSRGDFAVEGKQVTTRYR